MGKIVTPGQEGRPTVDFGLEVGQCGSLGEKIDGRENHDPKSAGGPSVDFGSR